MPREAGRFRERAFHAWLAARLPAGRWGNLPLGDDAAALPSRPGRVPVLSTDALVEGTHFLRDSPPRAIGSAAAAVNLSDLAAKGAEPAGLLLALLLPPTTSPAWARGVVLGAESAAARAGIHLIGGDTKPAPMRAVVGTVVGWGRPGHLAPRTGARPGDLVVTTGTVGRGGLAAERLRTGPRARALRELLAVTPRIAAGRLLASSAHAMLDTSDGLAEATRLLAAASRVRIEIDEAAVPWRKELHGLPAARRRDVGFFGGDYELLAALPPAAWARAARAVERTGVRLTRIGRVDRGDGTWLVSGERSVPMPPAGWDPFRTASRRRR